MNDDFCTILLEQFDQTEESHSIRQLALSRAMSYCNGDNVQSKIIGLPGRESTRFKDKKLIHQLIAGPNQKYHLLVSKFINSQLDKYKKSQEDDTRDDFIGVLWYAAEENRYLLPAFEDLLTDAIEGKQELSDDFIKPALVALFNAPVEENTHKLVSKLASSLLCTRLPANCSGPLLRHKQFDQAMVLMYKYHQACYDCEPGESEFCDNQRTVAEWVDFHLANPDRLDDQFKNNRSDSLL